MLSREEVETPVEHHISAPCMAWFRDPHFTRDGLHIEIPGLPAYEGRGVLDPTRVVMQRQHPSIGPHLIDLNRRGVGTPYMLCVADDSRDHLSGAWSSSIVRGRLKAMLRRGAGLSVYRSSPYSTETTGPQMFAVPWKQRLSPPRWIVDRLSDKVQLRALGVELGRPADFPDYELAFNREDILALIRARIQKDGVAVVRRGDMDGGEANLVDVESMDDPRLPVFLNRYARGVVPLLVERNVFRTGSGYVEVSLHVNLSHSKLLEHLKDPWNAPKDALVTTLQWAENGAWQGNLVSLKAGRTFTFLWDQDRAQIVLSALAEKVRPYVEWMLSHPNNNHEQILKPDGDGPARGWVCFDGFVTKSKAVNVLLTEVNPRETAITGGTRMLAYLVNTGRLGEDASISTTMLKTWARSWQEAYDGMNGYAFTRDIPVGGLVVNPAMIPDHGKFFLVSVGENPRDAHERHTRIKAMLVA